MVAKRKTIPFFTGTYSEVGDRILGASVDELLAATKKDPSEWRGLVLRKIAEQTPLTEVRAANTPAGSYLCKLLLFYEVESMHADCLFEEYGAPLWGLFAQECEHNAAQGVYPTAMIERVKLILRHNTKTLSLLIDYTSNTAEPTGVLRFVSAIALSGDWQSARRALVIEGKESWQSENATLRAAFELSNRLQKTFDAPLLLNLVGSDNLLPELRACAFKWLAEGERGNEGTIACAFMEMLHSPGNAPAFHAVCWRAPKWLPRASLQYVAKKLLSMSAEHFERTDVRRLRYCERESRLRAATAHYFLNLSHKYLLENWEQDRKSGPFTIGLTALMLLAKNKENAIQPDLAVAAELAAVNLFSDATQLSALMRMYDYERVPGRLSWNQLKGIITRFPEQITTTCVEIARHLRITGEDGDWPTAGMLVTFLEAAWENTRPTKHVGELRLIEIRDWLGFHESFPEATRGLTNLIVRLGIKERKRK